MTKGEKAKVLEIVDRCFHMFASEYRTDAQAQAKQMLAEQVAEWHISLADHREAMRMAAVGYVRELAAVTQERDGLLEDLAAARYAIEIDKATEEDLVCQLAEARRQVEAIIGAIVDDSCPPYTDCRVAFAGEDDRCGKCWRAWAAQRAKEGGGK